MEWNLRDKGYPQSRSEKSMGDGRKAVMTDSTPIGALRGTAYMGSGFVPSDAETALNKLVTAYNSKAFGVPNAPLLSNGSFDYVDPQTDSRAIDSTLAIRNHGGNRLGFVGKNVVDGMNTTYSAGLDNLPLGDNYINKSINTPLGTFSANYDGDGTGSLEFETVPGAYYLQALANLLRR